MEKLCVKFGNSMSRIGKQPIVLPPGVTANVSGQTVTVKGPKGELAGDVHPAIAVKVDEGKLVCTVAKPSKHGSALWGTTRANLANMVRGVVEGYRKQLELQGVGYRANLKGKDIELQVGFSHPVQIEAPEGVTFSVEKAIITVDGIDKQLVGQMAAEIRAVKPPEPYQGKGIRYVGEVVRRKVGKVVGATAA